MICGADNIIELFDLLHDGTIESFVHESDSLTLVVKIKYLTSRLEDSPDAFHVVLHGVQSLRFLPWLDDRAVQSSIDSPDEIFELKLDILSAEAVGETIRISCACDNSPKPVPYSGGFLDICLREAELRDGSEKVYSLEWLAELAWGYWEDLGRRGAD
jgi:hypothetical protein